MLLVNKGREADSAGTNAATRGRRGRWGGFRRRFGLRLQGFFFGGFFAFGLVFLRRFVAFFFVIAFVRFFFFVAALVARGGVFAVQAF
jgi:hypothetical protein